MPGIYYVAHKYNNLFSDSKITIRCRRWLKRILLDLLILIILGVSVILWAFAIEPSLLTVARIEIADERLPEGLDGLRAVFFADLHAGSCFSAEDAERVAANIEALNPDILLFGGDLTQYEPPETSPDTARVAAAFAKIKPRFGKYAVYGNHDLEAKGTAFEILTKGGFIVLENRFV